MSRIILTICLVFSSLGTLFAQKESTEVADTSAGLPKEYADYVVASKTLSPDKKFAVIYPKRNFAPKVLGIAAKTIWSRCSRSRFLLCSIPNTRSSNTRSVAE